MGESKLQNWKDAVEKRVDSLYLETNVSHFTACVISDRPRLLSVKPSCGSSERRP